MQREFDPIDRNPEFPQRLLSFGFTSSNAGIANSIAEFIQQQRPRAPICPGADTPNFALYAQRACCLTNAMIFSTMRFASADSGCVRTRS